MIVNINKMTLDNIYLYELVGNIRKGQHLTEDEKEFLNSFQKPKEEKIVYKSWIRKSKKKLSKKEYQHQYYLNVTKIKRQQKKLLKEE